MSESEMEEEEDELKAGQVQIIHTFFSTNRLLYSISLISFPTYSVDTP